MSTFLASQSMRVQQHFEVLEIDMPVITGACTIGAAQGFGTPRFCDQAWTGEYKTYYFTNENAPILPSINGEPIWRCIQSIRETTTELKQDKGLASKGSLSVTFADFKNQDPNPTAPGVTDAVKKQGTYFGKFSARQIFENKVARLKLYRVEADGSIDLANGAQTRSFITDTLELNTNSTWKLDCKDGLSLTNLGDKAWPISKGGFLRLGINDSVVAIPVDAGVDYSAVKIIRIGDEFLRVESISNNQTSTATLNVNTRGVDILAPVSSNLLSRTNADSHRPGDEVFYCEISDNENIDDLYARILTDSDLDSSFIPAAEWAAEVLEWHSTDKINTIHSESEDINKIITRLLTGFLMNSWYSVIENKVKLSAITVWKESSSRLTEGREINAHSIKKIAKEDLRATRALVVYDKDNLTDNNDNSSFNKASQFSDNTLISAALFTKHKDKLFENNTLIGTDASILLTQRYVSRFKFTPFERPFTTDERHMTFNVGDVVDLATTIDQGADGLQSGDIRAQITKINPKYSNKFGRSYDCKALTYEAAFNNNSEIVLDSPLNQVNLYVLAGAPSQVVTLTFILDGSFSSGFAAIRAGNFAAGSKLIIILANGFDGQADGGNGGSGQSITFDAESGSLITGSPNNGDDAGTVFDAMGIDCDIYFSGTTPSTAYPTANGFIRAPSGGAGGFNKTGSGQTAKSGNGGDGGDGRLAADGGFSGTADGGSTTRGDVGVNGEIDGSGSGFGVVGVANNAAGGAKGSGIKDSGATVSLFGDNPTRYINGDGSHP